MTMPPAEKYWDLCGEFLCTSHHEPWKFAKSRVLDLSQVNLEPRGYKSQTPHLSRAYRIFLSFEQKAVGGYVELDPENGPVEVLQPQWPQIDEAKHRFRATGTFPEHHFEIPPDGLSMLASCHELVRRAISANETTIGDGVRIQQALNAVEEEDRKRNEVSYVDMQDF